MESIELVKPGDIAFDVGAAVGKMTTQILDAGASFVVVVEPRPEAAEKLRDMFAESPVEVVEMAVSDLPGKANMFRMGWLSSLERKWQEGRFSYLEWGETFEVETTTLDQLIDTYGIPGYIKLDVEGHELSALRGLTHAVRCVHFEYHEEFLRDARLCAEQLAQIAPYLFSFSRGDYTTSAVMPNAEIELADVRSFYKALRKSESSWGMVTAILQGDNKDE